MRATTTIIEGGGGLRVEGDNGLGCGDGGSGCVEQVPGGISREGWPDCGGSGTQV